MEFLKSRFNSTKRGRFFYVIFFFLLVYVHTFTWLRINIYISVVSIVCVLLYWSDYCSSSRGGSSSGGGGREVHVLLPLIAKRVCSTSKIKPSRPVSVFLITPPTPPSTPPCAATKRHRERGRELIDTLLTSTLFHPSDYFLWNPWLTGSFAFR